MSSTSPKSDKKEISAEGSSKVEEKATESPELQTQPSSSIPPQGASNDDDDDDLSIPKPGPIPEDPTGIIEMETFQQIRDMDEDDDEEAGEDSDPREFSRGIVWGFFDQAEKTFSEMQEALREKDLNRLSSLGHFLKGSSAALGIIKVQAICEKIQHYGHKHDEDQHPIEEDDALGRIKALLRDAKKDYAVAKGWLVKLYEDGE